VGLPFGASQDKCPVRSLRQWLATSGISDGPVFRSVGRYGHVARRGLHKDSIGKPLKRAAARAEMNVDPLGGHSLRVGCVTQAAMNGVREFVIMKQTGHKTVATLRRYIRSGEIFRENGAAGLGIGGALPTYRYLSREHGSSEDQFRCSGRLEVSEKGLSAWDFNAIMDLPVSLIAVHESKYLHG
jgi:Phage integrase family